MYQLGIQRCLVGPFNGFVFFFFLSSQANKKAKAEARGVGGGSSTGDRRVALGIQGVPRMAGSRAELL